MYLPEHFEAKDANALIERLAAVSAAMLVTVDAQGAPAATHAPVHWDAKREILSGHIARANPQWTWGAGRGLVVLKGVEAYVSPSWYPSKAEHGKAVPTWNYEAVHLSGRVVWFEDAARLEEIVRALSVRHEAGREQPWSVDDAPRAYLDAMLRAIVGFELYVERMEAKQKLSQNKTGADYSGVIEGLEREGRAEIAALMRSVRP